MKAAFIEQFGGPEVLKYGDFPDPVAAPGEVVIAISLDLSPSILSMTRKASFSVEWPAEFI